MDLRVTQMNEEYEFGTKPNKRAKALDELLKATKKGTGSHNDSKKKGKNDDFEEEDNSDLDDFIEHDAEADRYYREVDSDEDSPKKALKKTKKEGLKERAQDTAHTLKFHGFGAGGARPESTRPAEKKNNVNLAAKKIDINNLFDQFDNGDLAKQSDFQYVMKTSEEKAIADCQSVVVVKPKAHINEDEGHTSLKKRKRESPERYIKEETKLHIEKASNKEDFQFYKATRHPDDVEPFRSTYADELNDRVSMELANNTHFGNTEIKTDSMMIEELLEADRNKQQAAGSQEEKQNEGDQTWDNFCRNVEFKTKTELETPSKAAEPLILENAEQYFYYIDIFEDPKEHPGDIFLFGKILSNVTRNTYESCCIIVKKSEREVYLVPSEYKRGLDEDENQDTENIDVNWASIMQEFRNKLLPSHQQRLKFKPVDRNYSFDLPILHGKRKYLKVKYDGTLPPINSAIKGKTFSHVIGTSWTLLENFVVKKRLMGPQWLKITEFAKPSQANKQSWCAHELIVDFKSISKVEKELAPPNPPLKVMTFALKSAKVNGNWELAAISAMTFNRVDTDKNIELMAGDLETNMFGIVRKLPDTYFPKDFEAKAKGFKHPIKVEESEAALISNFISQINSFDPDILSVHDAYTSVLDTFLGRVKKLKITNWSKVSRLKKTYQVDGSNLFRIRHATSGRLICDTFLSSRELIRETDYSLSYLAKNFLGQRRDDFDENSTQAFYNNSEFLLKMIDHTTQDAFITSRIMFRLQIIPLTKHLTCIAGNTWIKSLQNARAERNEMFLIHEFRDRKYIYPDKFYAKNDDKAVFEEEENPSKDKKTNKKDKKKYAGGLVLDPKPGLYNNIILLVDFNSLYPSIIREYNICFTTLKFPPKCLMDGIKDSSNKESEMKVEEDNQAANGQQGAAGDFDLKDIKRVDNPYSVLPTVIQSLIRQRKEVKNLLENERNESKKEIYDIKQKAIKLVANSMYGCLGFSSSRFYAKPIAATITRFGRQILEDTAKKVEEKTGMRIIYGDTDSLMIDTQTTKIEEAIELGRKVKKDINDKYKCLEIDIDGIFMPLLLLKKKKYAAMKLSNLGDFLRLNFNQPHNVQPIFKQEVKGLDMVRRDWCRISKRAGGLVLKEVLSGKGIDEVIDGIKMELTELGKRIRGESNQGCTLDEFIITKQLTKDPNKYPNDKGQPHVQVAKRMLEANKSLNLIHHYIPYVIIKSDKEGLADKAVHSEEFLKNKDKYEIDVDWYLQQQVMPPIQRLLEVIPGIIISEVALCLGLDGSKYKNARKRDEEEENEDYLSSYLASFLNKSESAEDAKVEFIVRCTQCHKEQKFGQKQERANMSIFTCTDPTCQGLLNQPQLFNLVKLRIKEGIMNYYRHPLSCNECQTHNHKRFLLNGQKCTNGHKLTEKTPRDILTWLRNVKAIFDRKQEEMDLLSANQKTFITTVQVYIDTTIKLSRAQILNLDSIFSKLKEIELR